VTRATPPTTGVILAGGRATRMGGRDKGLLPFRGRPLVAHALEVRAQVERVLINANRNLSDYAALDVPVITDTVPGCPGPLAGMLAGLRHAQTEWVLCIPCDAVRLPLDLAARLHGGAARDGLAAYATAGGDGLYTCCLLHRSLADAVERALQEGRASVRAFLEECGAVAVEFGNWPAVARNLNTPADLRDAAVGLP